MRFSRRTSWDLAANRLAAQVEAAHAAGLPLLDLAASNPTLCGLAWPEEELARALGSVALAGHDPEPAGPLSARQAVADYLGARGAPVDPGQVVLTCSTSEGYSFVLDLLCDPGDEVLVPAPSYPLLDVLAGLEGVTLRRYPLRWDGAWHLDLAGLAGLLSERTRAVLVVSPGNPTGASLSRPELEALEDLCAARGLALVGDEVFAGTGPEGAPSVAGARRCLAFQLSGLSKVCGLPQLKAAWVAVAGPPAPVREALRRLEVVADAFLSLSGPSAAAMPALLGARERFLGPLRERLAVNLAALRRAAGGAAPFDVLAGGGGWSAVVRTGQTVDEEALCLHLLSQGVVVQPGFFYDFERAGHLVLSLLPWPATFALGLERVRAALDRPW